MREEVYTQAPGPGSLLGTVTTTMPSSFPRWSINAITRAFILAFTGEAMTISRIEGLTA